MKHNLTIISTIFSFLLLSLRPVAAAGQDRKIERYLAKTERGLIKSNKKLEKKIKSSSDEELLMQFGDLELKLVKSTGQFAAEIGMSALNSTRENMLLFISQKSIDTQIALASKKIYDLGSLKKFKKLLKETKENLKNSENQKGIFSVLVYAYVAYVYVAFTIFFLCGEGGCGGNN